MLYSRSDVAQYQYSWHGLATFHNGKCNVQAYRNDKTDIATVKLEYNILCKAVKIT